MPNLQQWIGGRLHRLASRNDKSSSLQIATRSDHRRSSGGARAPASDVSFSDPSSASRTLRCMVPMGNTRTQRGNRAAQPEPQEGGDRERHPWRGHQRAVRGGDKGWQPASQLNHPERVQEKQHRRAAKSDGAVRPTAIAPNLRNRSRSRLGNATHSARKTTAGRYETRRTSSVAIAKRSPVATWRTTTIEAHSSKGSSGFGARNRTLNAAESNSGAAKTLAAREGDRTHIAVRAVGGIVQFNAKTLIPGPSAVPAEPKQRAPVSRPAPSRSSD